MACVISRCTPLYSQIRNQIRHFQPTLIEGLGKEICFLFISLHCLDGALAEMRDSSDPAIKEGQEKFDTFS